MTTVASGRCASALLNPNLAGPTCAAPHPYSGTARSRSALVITDTDDKLIAAAAMIGERSAPNTG